MPENKVVTGRLSRAAEVFVIDDAARIFEFSGSSEVPYRRNSWDGQFDEILGHSDGEIDLSRAESGALPLLWGHDSRAMDSNIGAVISVSVTEGRTMVRAQLHPTEDVAQLWQKIKAGTLRNISLEYQPVSMRLESTDEAGIPAYRVTRWRIHEFSIVSVPADFSVGIGRDADTNLQTFYRSLAVSSSVQVKEVNTMADEAPNTPAAPAVAPVTQAAAPTPLERYEQANAIWRDGMAILTKHPSISMPEASAILNAARSLDDVRDAVLARLAQPVTPPVAISGGEDLQRAAAVVGLENFLERRMGSTAPAIEQANQFRSCSMIEIAKRTLTQFAGFRNVDSMSRAEIAGAFLNAQAQTRYHSTSDFPNLLGNVAGKRLRMAYESGAPTYRIWAKRGPNITDFKEVSAIAMSQLPDFKLKLEGAEIKFGSVGEAVEKFSVLTYARGLKLTREAVINDDLRGFATALTGFGTAAARLENSLVYAHITGNPVMGDNVALFHTATHLNLAASGGAISDVTLGTGRTAMRNQKPLTPTGETSAALNIAPRFLIVGPAYEQLAYQWTSSNYVPSVATGTNEFRQGGATALTPVVDALITGNAWVLAADPNVIDTVEYAYLDGNEGVYVEQMTEFANDALNVKARLDFASKAIDWRGLYRNPGA